MTISLAVHRSPPLILAPERDPELAAELSDLVETTRQEATSPERDPDPTLLVNILGEKKGK